MNRYKYVLLTPARNAAKTLAKTLDSVVAQSVRPARYVIISDGSIDHTDELAQLYAKKYDFILFKKVEHDKTAGFAGKVRAINAGMKELHDAQYDFIGNLDADISFEPHYFETIFHLFDEDKKLGIAGGHICELVDSKCTPQAISPNSVAGAVQLFRKECFFQIGGYLPLQSGAIDAAAEIIARSKGWHVKTVFDLKVIHHGPVLTGNSSPIARFYRHGKNNFRLGYHPFFQISSALGRLLKKPYFIGGAAFLAGYLSQILTREKRCLPDEVVNYLRNEQMIRLAAAGKKMFAGGKD